MQTGTPAAAAGVEQGDVILSFDGKPIDQVRQLSRAVAAVVPGSDAEIVVWRGGKEVTLQAEIAQMPGQEQVASADQAHPAPISPAWAWRWRRSRPSSAPSSAWTPTRRVC